MPQQLRGCRFIHYLLFSLQCNVQCGNGTQRRDIICVQRTGADFAVAPASECAHLDKPAAVQECETGECQPQWFTTEWSAVRGWGRVGALRVRGRKEKSCDRSRRSGREFLSVTFVFSARAPVEKAYR